MVRMLSAVYLTGQEAALVCAESPGEARVLVETAVIDGMPFVELTLANPDDELEPDEPRWNGRPVYVRAEHVCAIGPPLSPDA
jgi:hypothetical protein